MSEPVRSPRRYGAAMRLAAFFAAAALCAVSVQASVLDACGLCPVDCPMHATRDAAGHAGEKTEAKMRCHGTKAAPLGGGLELRRPPCKTSLTLATSLLPPFVLADREVDGVILPIWIEIGWRLDRLHGRTGTPETPPPILFV